MRVLLMGGRAVALLLVLAVAGSLAGWGPEAAYAQSAVWRFGAVLVLSGDGAAYGNSQREGLELARDTINEAGGIHGMPVEIIFEDSRGERTDAVNAVLKLINRDRVLAIIGPTYSPEMFAAGPAADRARVTIMGISTTAVGIGEIGPYVFRNSLPEEGVI
ncbi:MAG: ABC transporter substrate-binding protein, partial [Limnochordales bacterium]